MFKVLVNTGPIRDVEFIYIHASFPSNNSSYLHARVSSPPLRAVMSIFSPRLAGTLVSGASMRGF
jgi:hypothetical protein